jgi:hypothetical protein
MNRFKATFSIHEIGHFNFYVGILTGLGVAVFLNKLVVISLQLMSIDIYVDYESMYHNLQFGLNSYYLAFAGLLSVSIGFCSTTYLWMSKLRGSFKNKTRRLRMAQSNAIWVKYLCLMFLLRLLLNLIGIQILFEEKFGYYIFLLPLFIFLFCWQHISQIYISLKPMLISLVIAIGIGFLLSYL